MGHIKFITSTIMAVLFAVAIIAFTIDFGNDNNAPVNLVDDPDFSDIKNEMTGNLTQFHIDANSSGVAFIQTQLETGDEVTKTGGQFKVGIGTAMKMVTSVIRSGYKKIFGSDTGFGIFLTALISILGFTAFALAYKAWVGRNPE